MKKIKFLLSAIFAFVFAVSLTACSGGGNNSSGNETSADSVVPTSSGGNNSSENNSSGNETSTDIVTPSLEQKIKMSFSGNEITVTLTDNSASRDLVQRLKSSSLTLSFRDYGGSEKIAYPEPALDLSDTEGCDPVVGDLTIYTPWGNLAAFYRDTSGFSNSLVKIGTIDGDGIEKLAAQNGEFSVTLELL